MMSLTAVPMTPDVPMVACSWCETVVALERRSGVHMSEPDGGTVTRDAWLLPGTWREQAATVNGRNRFACCGACGHLILAVGTLLEGNKRSPSPTFEELRDSVKQLIETPSPEPIA